jgi:hypothetical protein
MLVEERPLEVDGARPRQTGRQNTHNIQAQLMMMVTKT